MTLKRRSKISTPICNHYRWRNTSLAKKLESFRFLRDAIEKAKAKVSEPDCCHSQVKPSKTIQKDGLAPPPTLLEEIHNDNFQAKLQALEMMELAKKRKQFERKIEIIKRLLSEQRVRRNVNPSDKLKGRKRQKPVTKCVNKRLAVAKMRKSSDISKDESTESDHNFKGLSSAHTVLLEPRNDFLSLPISYFHENLEIHKAINLQFEPIHAISSDKKVTERFPESFLEKIKQGKLQIDRGWFSKPAEIIFKYERNDPMAVYKKSAVIKNTGRCLAYCGFVAVDCNMLVHPKTFTGCNDIERISPGMTLCFDLTFCTQGELVGDFRAKAYFLTRREGLEGYVEIPVLCHPTVCGSLQPSVVSTNIHFRKMNYWDKSSSQIMFLTNPLDEPCEVYFDSNTDKILGAFKENLKRLKKDKESYVLDKHYGKRIKKELSRIVANYVVEYIINNIFEPIQTIPRYFAQIPSNSKLPITIKFSPQLVNKEDFIVKKIIVDHTIKNQTFLRNEITVHAKTEGLPIVIEPHLLDFKIGLIGVCLQQTSFTVTNTGKIAVPLKVTVENSLRKFVTIRPNSLFVLAGQSNPVSVCLKIGPGFEEDANKFIDRVMRILEFPIFIHQASIEHKDKITPLILPAMAVLTNTFALEVSEKTIDFGTVYLSTSSLRRLKIVNRSPLLQFYGFLNVPDSIIIEPGCGFGYIYPGEVLNVDLIYSPEYEEMACSDGQKFIRNVIVLYTVLSASHFKNFQAKIIKHETEKQEKHNNEAELIDIDTHLEANEKGNKEKISNNEDSVGNIESSQQALLLKNINKDDRLSIGNLNLLDVSNGAIEKHFGQFVYDEGIHDGDKTAFNRVSQSNPNLSEVNEVIPTSNETDAFHDEIQPIESIYSMPIECLATVVRPIMEFSSQKVILPSTPCGSSSFASVYLRFLTISERPQDACVCGEKTKRREFTANFYLTTNDDCINVQPISGEIHENMSQKVFIEYRPTLKKEALMQKAYELQLEAENKSSESNNKNVSGTPKPSSKKTKTRKKATGTSTGKRSSRKVVKIDESMYQQARESLLKSFEPIKKTVIISCILEILIKNNHEDGRESKQNIVLEEVECHVVCTVVKPDFILKTAARKVDFGLVAGGMRKTMSVEVENISENPIYLRLSYLNPIGSFSHSLRTLPIQCKNYQKIKGGTKEMHKCSLLIDPEETRQIKITFASNEGDLMSYERLDIEGGKTKVVLFLQAQPVAKGVLFNPLVDFYRMECGFGGNKKVEVMVTSTSKALQHLCIKREYLKAIPLNVLPVDTETKAEKLKSSKQQKKSAESSKAQERTTSKGKSGKQTPQNLNKEEKQFFDNYESTESYEFEDLFSLTFEEVEKIKSKKGKPESKEKKKKNNVQVESEKDLGPQEKSEIDLQHMGKCRLILMFSVKEAGQLHNSVRKFQTTFTSDLVDSSNAELPGLSMQEQKLISPDELDSIAFYKNMIFVAKYKVILGLETTVLDFYFVGKVIGK